MAINREIVKILQDICTPQYYADIKRTEVLTFNNGCYRMWYFKRQDVEQYVFVRDILGKNCA